MASGPDPTTTPSVAAACPAVSPSPPQLGTSDTLAVRRNTSLRGTTGEHTSPHPSSLCSGQAPGAAIRTPANSYQRQSPGTGSSGPRSSMTASGERVSVLLIFLASGP